MTALRSESDQPAARIHAAARRHAAVSAILLPVIITASVLYAAGPVHTSRKYWIGRNIGQAEMEFGRPTFSEPLVETGGMLVIYASRKDPVHFVFETNAGGQIVKAARVE
jgi:hypothetical protein